MAPRNAAVAALLGLVLLSSVMLACGAIEDDPPRNPLEEDSAAATTPPSPQAVATIAATPVPTDVAGNVLPPPASLAEPATGRAIELLAEWLGAPQPDFARVSVEATVWPDACLGIAQPISCAQVVTPGFVVRLTDALGTPHTVHIDGSGRRARWAGEAVASGIVTAIDMDTSRLTVRLVDGHALELRIAPGTAWDQQDTPPSLVTRSVIFGYDPASTPAAVSTLAWVVVAPP
jgi:hypothetical protein